MIFTVTFSKICSYMCMYIWLCANCPFKIYWGGRNFTLRVVLMFRLVLWTDCWTRIVWGGIAGKERKCQWHTSFELWPHLEAFLAAWHQQESCDLHTETHTHEREREWERDRQRERFGSCSKIKILSTGIWATPPQQPSPPPITTTHPQLWNKWNDWGNSALQKKERFPMEKATKVKPRFKKDCIQGSMRCYAEICFLTDVVPLCITVLQISSYLLIVLEYI